jgi:hypothetical protein
MIPSAAARLPWAEGLRHAAVAAVVFLGSYHLNDWFFTHFRLSETISWIFMPAAIRLILVLVFGIWGALGLWLGSFVQLYFIAGDGFAYSALVSWLSAFCPFIAVQIGLRWFKLPANLQGLRAAHLIDLSVLAAVTSVVPHNFLFYAFGRVDSPWSGMVPMFIGDLVGTTIVLTLAWLVLLLVSRRAPPPNSQ